MIKGKKGFTLVEMIVAIALIGIIAVGIIPAFAAQFKMTIDSRGITTTGFDAQGAMESSINAVLDKLKDDAAYSGTDLTAVTKSIFGRNVTLYQVSQTFPMNGNKSFTVFLSEKLAEMSYRKPLVANLVRIDGKMTDGTTAAGITVASVRSGSKLASLNGTYNIADYSSSQDLNLYQWYRSKEGFSNPLFPDDYEMIDALRNKATLTVSDLKTYAVNRNLMLTLIPVDKSGVRGSATPSSNSVYIQGDEWRSGTVAWIDKNSDASYDNGVADVAVKYSISKDSWPLLSTTGFNTKNSYPDPSDATKTLDFSNGSLYVPMGVERSQLTDIAGTIKADNANNQVNWTVDKSINLANTINETNDGGSITMKTLDGNITLYQYVSIKTSDPNGGDAQYGTDGKVILITSGAALSTKNNISLTAGDSWGNLNLQPYTSLTGQNIALKAAEYVAINGSTLNATASDGTISIESAKKNITLQNTTFSAKTVMLKSDTTMTGGSWNSGTTVTVPDGTLLAMGKGDSAKINNGGLSLGNTGAVTFVNGNDTDLTTPLSLSLTKKSSSQVLISSNYGRKLNYAGGSDETAQLNTDSDLGSGSTNLEYTLTKVPGGHGNSPVISLAFDGQNTISINASGTGAMKANYQLTVTDKYAEGVSGTIAFQVRASADDTSPTVSIIGSTMPSYTVTFYTRNSSNTSDVYLSKVASVSYGYSLSDIGAMPSDPTLTGYTFTGWQTRSGSTTAPFTKDIEITQDTSVYASFSKNPVIYYVTFYNQTGYSASKCSQLGSPVAVYEGSSVDSIKFPTPTWSGYQLLGWSTTINGGNINFTSSTTVNQNLSVYSQWGVPLSGIAGAAYVTTGGIGFQKIGNNLLLANTPLGDSMIWSAAVTSAQNFIKNNLSVYVWLNSASSGLLDKTTISSLDSSVLNIGTSWWSATAVDQSYAYYVNRNGALTNGLITYSRLCRPYIQIPSSVAVNLYGQCIWMQSYSPGVKNNPYLIYYKQ